MDSTTLKKTITDILAPFGFKKESNEIIMLFFECVLLLARHWEFTHLPYKKCIKCQCLENSG